LTACVALLRGINVGGHHRVAMAELREIAQSLGLRNVSTYIQSGNLIFDATPGDSDTPRQLEQALVERFGFEIPVVTRSRAEMEEAARSHPFVDLGLSDSFLMVAFLDREPEVDIEDVLDAREFEPDRFALSGREIFLAYPEGSGRSKLTHELLQRRLGVTATIRNRKTILRLIEVSDTGRRA